MITGLALGAALLLHTKVARAEHGLPNAVSTAASAKMPTARAEADVLAARYALSKNRSDETLFRRLIDALTRVGRLRDALAEADQFASRVTATAALRAQRGFLRQQLGDVAGAIDDFAAALKGSELANNQRRNVEAALIQAQAMQAQGRIDAAQSELTRGEFDRAAEAARRILGSDPESEAAMRIRVEALQSAGQGREALVEATRFVEHAAGNPFLLAQRGFLRRQFNDPRGAAEDFHTALAVSGLSPEQRKNLEMALAEARIAEAQDDLNQAEAALKRQDYAAALELSKAVSNRGLSPELAMRIRVEALSRTGRKREAVHEADGYMGAHAASAVFQAQRGYLRRELQNASGAIEDFTSALAGEGLTVEQRRNVQLALVEAQTAQFVGTQTPIAAAVVPNRIATLLRAGRKSHAKAEASRQIARGDAKGWVFAQRGFLRLDAGEYRGAVQDFDAALTRSDLDRQSIPSIRYARARATALLAERAGKPEDAEEAYRDFLETDPKHAEAWFQLGYLLLKQGRPSDSAEALNAGLAIRPVGPAFLDAGGANIFMSAPLASKLYREGLDRWYAGDPSLADKSAIDMERVRNSVVEADASIRTTLAVGAIMGRPQSAGGSNTLAGAETRVRFDGRYLPAVPGLEAVARGLSGKDATGERETDAGIGFRYRPFRGLNLYVGGMFDHFFQPDPKAQFVMTWGLGLGADAYPYTVGWMPYWDFATIGAWRTSEARVLEDTRANLGFLYGFHAPTRGVIGPTIWAVAGYDNRASTPMAGAIGPSILSVFLLGGDKYRSYDAVLSIQFGYLFSIGEDERQRGWRGIVGLTF